MLLKLHSKIEEALHNPNHGTVIDGAFATQAFDTSAELIDVAGTDISSLNEDGVLNTEHNNPDKKDSATFNVIIGRIIFAKKIFGEKDCESEREMTLWETLGVPFIYGAAELFDAEDHENAKAAAAIIKHYHRRHLPVVIRYSIEGSTLQRNGPHLTKTIARRVAATIKPCNKSSYNYLVAEAAPPQQMAIEKNEQGISPYISIFEMEYAPLLETPIDSMRAALDDLKELNKTFTLGGAGGAPSTLTGGAATSVEDVHKKNFMKSQVLAAFRDWDGVAPFKKFLKHRLPDADDNFVERFMEVANQIKVVKAQAGEDNLQKKDWQADDYGAQPLAELNQKTPSGAKVFKGKYVKPGEVEITAGPVTGSKLKLLHLDDTHAWVQPFKAGDTEVKVNKLARKLEGSHFRILTPPETLKVPNFVDGNKHSDPGTTESHEQKELMHGIDLASDPLVQTHPHGSTEARTKGTIGWFKSAKGKLGYVKPAVNYWEKVRNEKEALNPKSEEYMSTARREVVYHNVANNFFGLGEHVPTTAMFKDPHTKHEHSVMELIPFGTHTKMNANEHESRDRVVQAGDTGQLDKMAVMDIVMGNPDRERINYMTSPNHPHVHLIDNALIFNYDDHFVPSYLTDYHHFKGVSMDSSHLHPEATKWLTALDPFNLGIEMARQGVHQKIINQAVSRLLSMQSEAVMGQTNKNRILFAHSRYSQIPGVA